MTPLRKENLPHATAITVIAITAVVLALVFSQMEREERQSEFGQFVTNKN